MLLDPSKRAEDWLADLTREAEEAYNADRVADLRAALDRLSRALALIGASGSELDIRTRDAAEGPGTGAPRG